MLLSTIKKHHSQKKNNALACRILPRTQNFLDGIILEQLEVRQRVEKPDPRVMLPTVAQGRSCIETRLKPTD